MLARKVGMTSAISADGGVVAITILAASPNIVSYLKTVERDGYSAIQLGFETAKRPLKPLAGQYQKLDHTPKVVREVRSGEDVSEINVGDLINVETFSVGDLVSVSGIGKGKGWAGTIKRHNFHRGRKTHGGRSYRRPGSIGSMYPQHILKGKKMAGQMGGTQVTTRGLKIALIDAANNLIGISGNVPGPKKGLVLIKEQK